MFEACMIGWHVTPDYIVKNWSEELLILMCEKAAERMEKMSGKARGGGAVEVGASEMSARLNNARGSRG